MPFVVELPRKFAEQAHRVARCVNLADIRILEVHARIINAEAAQHLLPIESFDTQVRVHRDSDDLMFRFEHEFTFKGADDKDAVQVAVHVGAAFDFAEEANAEDLSEEELAAFGRTTVQMAIYPYVRATVSDLTSRLGCEAVTLDLLVLKTEAK
jgi:hypothetical protein